MASPFDILQIDPDASDEEIERAYRERVKEAHPDQGGSAEEFLVVKAAYEELQAGQEHVAVEDLRDLDEEDTEDLVEEATAEVEYLDYEALEDFGWSLEDDALFEKAAEADLDPADHGTLEVDPTETLLEAAEAAGYAWPFACRGGACANCAVAVCEGEVTTPVNHILPPEMTDRGIRLSCVGAPVTDELQVVFNVKHLPDLDELRLPPRPFEGTNPGD